MDSTDRAFALAVADYQAGRAQVNEALARLPAGLSKAAIADRHELLTRARAVILADAAAALVALANAGLDVEMDVTPARLTALMEEVWQDEFGSAWGEMRNEVEAEACDNRMAA